MAEEAQTGVPAYPVTVIAKLLDLTERQVHYHARNGVIPMPVKQRFDLVGSVQGYIRFLRKRQGSETAGPNAKDRILTAKARQAEAEADLMDGTALHRTAVEAAWIKVLALLRTRLLAIPARTAPLVEAAPDLPAINAILTGAIHDALSALAVVVVVSAEKDPASRSASTTSPQSAPDVTPMRPAVVLHNR
jgi:hypothetical protein